MIVIQGDTAHDLKHFNGLWIKHSETDCTYEICGLMWDYTVDAYKEVVIGGFATSAIAKMTLKRIERALERGLRWLYI